MWAYHYRVVMMSAIPVIHTEEKHLYEKIQDYVSYGRGWGGGIKTEANAYQQRTAMASD